MDVSARSKLNATGLMNTSPESLGLPCASLYIGLMMLFIPFPFSHLFHHANNSGVGQEVFPRGEVRSNH